MTIETIAEEENIEHDLAREFYFKKASSYSIFTSGVIQRNDCRRGFSAREDALR
jgi:hypothetical protein